MFVVFSYGPPMAPYSLTIVACCGADPNPHEQCSCCALGGFLVSSVHYPDRACKRICIGTVDQLFFTTDCVAPASNLANNCTRFWLLSIYRPWCRFYMSPLFVVPFGHVNYLAVMFSVHTERN